jgi:hypothetical protein
MENKEELNPVDIFKEYGYKEGQELLVPVEFIYGVLNFCGTVKASQPKVGVLSSYPKDVREIRNKDTDELERVDIDWELHNGNSFFNTALNYKPDDYFIVTDLEMRALQIENGLTHWHKNNIEQGIAVAVPKEVGDN